MAKLNLPQVSPLDVPGGIDINTGARAVLGALGIGNAQQQQGQLMIGQGAQQVEQANAGLEESLFQTVSGKANSELATRVAERMQKTTNEDGSPAFSTLQSDIEEIHNDVSTKYGKGLLNPRVAQKFKANMTDLKTRHSISAMEASRKQQGDWAQASLINFTNDTQKAALTDSYDNLPAYMNQIDNAIDSQVANGWIKPDVAAKMKIEMRNTLGSGKMSTIVAQNPEIAKALLEDSSKADMFGLDEIERVKYLKQAESSIQHKQLELERQQTKQLQIEAQKRKVRESQLEVGIIDGKVTRATLDSELNQGNIDDNLYSNLVSKLDTYNRRRKSEDTTLEDLTAAVNNKEILGNRFSSKSVDKYYNQTASLMKRSDGLPPTMRDKAKIAAGINAPVNAFAAELKGVIYNSDSPKQVLDAIQAYDELLNVNPLAVSGVDKETADMIGYLSAELKFGYADPQKTLNKVREKLKSITPQDRELYTQKLQQDEDYKLENVDSLVEAIIPTNGWFSSPAKPSENTKAAIRHLYAEAFKEYGDSEVAKKIVSNKIMSTFGVTEVNGNKVITFLPPEKHPGFIDPHTKQLLSVETMNEMFHNKVKDALVPNNPYLPTTDKQTLTGKEISIDISQDDLFIEADGKTSISNPSYAVRYVDPKTGATMTLTYPNGVPVRFEPDQSVVDKQHEGRVKEADIINENTIKSINSPQHGESLWDMVKGFIMEKEGFRSVSKFDVNAYRVGYGSDTITRADGSYSKVQPGTTVSRADAERDLIRRLPEYDAIARRVLGDSYDSLPNNVKTAVISLTYNGALKKEYQPKLRAAIESGDMNKIANVVENIKTSSPGLESRRKAESDLIRNHPDVPKTASPDKLLEIIKSSSPSSPLQVARSLIGVNELSGTKVLQEFFKRNIGSKIDPRQIPWCAAFVNSVLSASGYSQTGSLAARSFLNYGKKAVVPQQGDIVILTRGNDPSKGHVGFLVEMNDKFVKILGGNQANGVNSKWYPKSSILGIRTPVKTAGVRG